MKKYFDPVFWRVVLPGVIFPPLLGFPGNSAHELHLAGVLCAVIFVYNVGKMLRELRGQ